MQKYANNDIFQSAVQFSLRCTFGSDYYLVDLVLAYFWGSIYVM